MIRNRIAWIDGQDLPSIATRLTQLPADLIVCLGFFSRVPVPVNPTAELRSASGAWPLCGLVVAIVPALVLAAATGAGMPGPVAAALAVAALVAITGALHEDGLADTADGLGGGDDKQQKLAIMRDSRIGGYGALALITVMFVKIAALASLSADGIGAVLALCGAAAISRALALWFWQATGPATPDGLAATAGRPDAPALAVGLGTGVIVLVLLLAWFGGAALFAVLLAGLATIALARLVTRQVGGHTGDTIGAAQQVAETLMLAGLSTAAGLVP